MNIDQAIDNAEQISLSNDQIMKAFNGKTKIVLYSDLDSFQNIESLLQPYDNVIVLLQTENKKTGHWVCIFKRNNTISFFDSYGLYPDTQIRYCPYLLINQRDQHVFTRLLKDAQNKGYNIEINRQRYQDKDIKKGPEPNTCGRHCIVRLFMKALTNDQYSKFIKSSRIDPDKIVSMLTYIL